MNDLVTYLVQSLVGDDVPVTLEEEKAPGERTIFVHLPEAERGVVIGRQGRTIRALETVIAAAPDPEGRRTALKVSGRS